MAENISLLDRLSAAIELAESGTLTLPPQESVMIVSRRQWDDLLFAALGLPADMFVSVDRNRAHQRATTGLW